MLNGTKLYAPLPQSISDSEDSEKELQMNSLHSPMKNSNTTLNQRLNFTPPYELPKVKHVKKRMSPLRKVAFAVSVVMCFLPIIVFLWIIPCNVNTCPVELTNWENQQEEVEIKGVINLIRGRVFNSYNLALMYKGNVNSSEVQKHGIISFNGNNGEVSWYIRQESVPLKLDCNLIDLNQNGILDCLLLDEKGLKGIEAASGIIIWHAHSYEEKAIINKLQFPVKIADLNGDGVDELLCVYQNKYLLIISGKNGKALNNIMIDNCNSVDSLKVADKNIQYVCVNETIQLKMELSLSDLEKRFWNNSHIVQFKTANETNDRESYRIDDKELIVQNEGSFPNCRSTLTLYNAKLGEKMHSWSYINSYIMKPVKFSFESSRINKFSLRGHISGFIVKIWHWPSSQVKRFARFLNKRADKTVNPDNYHINFVTERIVLITVNETSYNEINVSLADIKQLCFKTHGGKECQPDLKNQEDSLLIADLDSDGTQELISYSSSFYPHEVANRSEKIWKLISTVKVIKLEAELPKLYEVN